MVEVKLLFMGGDDNGKIIHLPVIPRVGETVSLFGRNDGLNGNHEVLDVLYHVGPIDDGSSLAGVVLMLRPTSKNAEYDIRGLVG